MNNPSRAPEDQAPSRKERFELDHARLRELLIEAYGGDADPIWYGQDGVAATVLETLRDAYDAIEGPDDVELQAYRVDADAILICVRERDQSTIALRQIAGYAIETRRIVDPDNESFDECDAMVTELLGYATELLPALRALQAGERQRDPDRTDAG